MDSLTTGATVYLAMRRQARLETPNTLHHVMVRGLERRAIFRDDVDRTDFVPRLAALAEQGAWTVSAWALLPNHAHLLHVHPSAIPKAARRGATAAAEWRQLLGTIKAS